MEQADDSEKGMQEGVKFSSALAQAWPEKWPNLLASTGPYARLARWDRPVGIWLLLLPCWMGLALMRVPTGFAWIDVFWFPLFAIGAIAMRGAGCTWNDITDRDIDTQVSRTASRPLPAGDITLKNAYVFLSLQLAVGALVWLCLPTDAKIVAILAIPLVVAYPFMKRITWWPQLWLGFTFSWGALVGAATASYVSSATVFLYLGLVCWTIAYDTIYALQDKDDDALIGVKSTARLFDTKVLTGIFVFHLAATSMITCAAYFAGAPRMGALTGLVFLAFGVWQATQLAGNKTANALAMFKANVFAGAIIVVGLSLAVLL